MSVFYKWLAIALAIVGLFILLAVDAKADERTVQIKNDPGGSVQEYLQAIEYFKQNRIKLTIEGYCASACTLVLLTPPLNVCIKEGTKFGFHKPYAMTSEGEVIRNIDTVYGSLNMWTELFYPKYPDWLKKILDKNKVPSVFEGDKPDDMLWIEFPALKEHLKVC